MQGTDSFFPYQAGGKWYALYGSARTEHLSIQFWPLGLVSEGNGLFTLFYSANEHVAGAQPDTNGITLTPGSIGLVEVRLADDNPSARAAAPAAQRGREEQP